MSRRISQEARILEYFDNQPLATAQAIFGLVQARMKARVKSYGEPAARAMKPKRTRAKKVNSQPEGGIANMYVEPRSKEVVA